MQDMNSIEKLRLQLLANGYTPIRNHDKRTFMKSWPTATIDAAEIERWSRRFSRDKATGIRVEDGLAVIDIDIDDEHLVNAIANAILDIVPELENENVPLLIRRGKGFKEAWFVRTAELFSRIHSRSWTPPGAAVDAGAHRIEVFGGAAARQFGSYGPHTLTDDGVVAVVYRWEGRSPEDTPKSELPILTKQQFFDIVDATERLLEAAGWQVVELSTKGENDVSRLYDLTEDMHFDLNTGQRVSLLELRELAAVSDGIRCSAAFVEGPSAKRTDRCIVGVNQQGSLTIWESASGVTHCEAGLAPRDYSVEINRVAERLKEIDEKRRNKVSSADSAVVAATKLLATYAFCPYQQLGVVPIYTTSADDGMTLASFRTMMLPNCDEETGPRGGRVVINPVDIWSKDERRITVRGARMRPDKERPLYEEGGERWVNTYTPVAHDATGGSPDAAIALVEHLLPDEKERHWFCQWLAHKVRFPFIPGPAVIMVARQFGTGRGTLVVLMGKLLGPRYVMQLPFHMFAGKSYQSQYDDWGAGTLMACIAEAAEPTSGSSNGSTYRDKQETYTHLKSLVEPRAIERRYTSKRQHFTAMSFTSYFIATNEADALPIPDSDRRIAVLTNGDTGTPEFWREINEGLDNDANVAAFHDWLMRYDLTRYNPYEAPPRTAGRAMMVEMSKSEVDRGLEAAFEVLQGDIYTVDMILQLMKDAEIEYGLNYPKPTETWQAIAKRLIVRRGYRVGVPHGMNWTPQFDGVRVSVYATSAAVAKHWEVRSGLREALLSVSRETPRRKSFGEKIVDLQARRDEAAKGEASDGTQDTHLDTPKKR